jgi:hypothetical protein
MVVFGGGGGSAQMRTLRPQNKNMGCTQATQTTTLGDDDQLRALGDDWAKLADDASITRTYALLDTVWALGPHVRLQQALAFAYDYASTVRAAGASVDAFVGELTQRVIDARGSTVAEIAAARSGLQYVIDWLQLVAADAALYDDWAADVRVLDERLRLVTNEFAVPADELARAPVSHWWWALAVPVVIVTPPTRYRPM